MDIHETGIEGRIIKFIQNFLKLSSSKVKLNETLSDTKFQTEGLPQGSVVSPNFFIHKTNKIVAELTKASIYQISLYMDDLQISYRHQNLKDVERKLEYSKNIVENLSRRTASSFSQAKHLCYTLQNFQSRLQ